jgi:hypothetical protein
LSSDELAFHADKNTKRMVLISKYEEAWKILSNPNNSFDAQGTKKYLGEYILLDFFNKHSYF